MSTITVNEEVCKGCGLCIKACPKGIVAYADHFNNSGYTPARLENEAACTGCALCAVMCPEAAIRVFRGTGQAARVVSDRPRSMTPDPTTYCPGCTHGIVQRMVAETIDEMGIREEVIGVTSIGCSIFIYKSLDIDYCEGAHGRAPAVATGVKRVHPDKIAFTYQGDGDIAAIGTAEIIHAAARGENFTVVFVNNGNYGMTGGQMAPTTVLSQVTTTTPFGRQVSHGHPIRVCELLATIEGSSYLARGAADSPKNVLQTKKYIKKAFERQMAGKGFSLVEILSTCPANWSMTPVDALGVIEEKMIPVFPLGEIKVRE